MKDILLAPFIGIYQVGTLLGLWIYTAIRSLLPRNQKSVKDEVVLITGAGSGIGRLMAYKFAELGAIVVCTDINKQTADETCNAIIEKNGRAFSYFLDVTNSQKVYDLAKTIQTEIGDVDILINNAGIVTGRTFMNCPDELIIKTMEVNTISHFWTLKAFLGVMIKRNHGHIVSIASLAGHLGSPHLIDYTASKFGAVGLMDSLKLELFKEAPNVYTTTVCPYYINTGMFQGVEIPESLLFKWTDAEDAANEIVAGVLNNEAEIFIPRYRCYLLLILKSLVPSAVTRKLSDFLGVHNVMSAFVGRHGKKQN